MTEEERRTIGCPRGYHEILAGHEKTFASERRSRTTVCHGPQNRLLCLNNQAVARNCNRNWNRKRGGGKKCDKRQAGDPRSARVADNHLPQ
ncbi:hypothetical protein BJX70DRAFT_397914 [Aspergillus crustosus]